MEDFTSDPTILNVVKYGLVLNFVNVPPPRSPSVYNLCETDACLVDSKVSSLLAKGVILPSSVQDDDYFSPVFPRINKDGSVRLLLNLSHLNTHIHHQHFKMESFKDVRCMVTKGCWMASVDLKSAFYSIPIHPTHRKYLKFFWKRPYEYVVMPNGYSDAPRVFTKVSKPGFAELRAAGHLSVVFLDDSYL